ncbi:MAG TPA: penicillin-binding transpeptidase domain-containing protein [Solirubrobacteraceae bacterium]
MQTFPQPRRRPNRAGRRAIALAAAAALLALVAGLAIGANGGDERRAVVERFARAWERGDYAAMHKTLSKRAAARTPTARLQRTYADAAAVATVERVEAGRAAEVEGDETVYTVPVRLRTRVFGTVSRTMRIPVSGDGEAAGVDWTAAMAFPGLRRGERLTRQTELAPRADILARDGTPLVEGPDRTSDLGPLAAEIAGRLGPIPPAEADRYEKLGVPAGTLVGLNGLEREFDERLLGRPGGTLRAGSRVLAAVRAQPGGDVRTSIDPEVQRAAVEALAGRFGGIAVLKPATGEVLGLAGIAYSAPQPPGSVFKIITLAGALEYGVVKPGATFPRQTAAVLVGVELENANGEVCGGSLADSFAHSCNSVFAPLGAKLGPKRLVEAAERFGFNEAPALRGAAPSTIPEPAEIGTDDLALGSAAIGQGKVLATPLHMAGVAAAIAEGGRRHRPSLLRGGGDRSQDPKPATSPQVARTVARFMRRVVQSGTGTAAAIKGVGVAGKTGTAELRDTTQDATAPPGEAATSDASDTDAWFAAFAPARRPRIAVAVLLVGQGAGGETAAPAARQVLLTALKSR